MANLGEHDLYEYGMMAAWLTHDSCIISICLMCDWCVINTWLRGFAVCLCSLHYFGGQYRGPGPQDGIWPRTSVGTGPELKHVKQIERQGGGRNMKIINMKCDSAITYINSICFHMLSTFHSVFLSTMVWRILVFSFKMNTPDHLSSPSVCDGVTGQISPLPTHMEYALTLGNCSDPC